MGSFLRGNLVWILLSLFLSTALWVVVTFQQNPEVTNTLTGVPVEITAVPRTMFVQQETQSVQLTVSAPRDVWPQLTSSKFRVIADASTVTPGVDNVVPKVISTDPRARVEDVIPPEVALRVEKLLTKQVPVQVITHGNVPVGYTPGTPHATPSEVTLTGPETSVSQVQVAIVDVNLENVTKTIDQTAKAIPETNGGAQVDRVTVSPEVLVEVPVEQRLAYKVVPIAPNLQGHVAAGYQLQTVTVDPVTVQLVGAPKVLDQMQSVSTQPISIEGLTADQDVSTTLALPGTVALASQQSIVVHLRIRETEGSVTFYVSPQLANRDPKLTYQFTPGAVNVTLAGPVSALTRLQPGDIQVVVDVKDLKAGTTQAVKPVVGGWSSSVRLVEVQPRTITVTVK